MAYIFQLFYLWSHSHIILGKCPANNSAWRSRFTTSYLAGARTRYSHQGYSQDTATIRRSQDKIQPPSSIPNDLLHSSNTDSFQHLPSNSDILWFHVGIHLFIKSVVSLSKILCKHSCRHTQGCNFNQVQAQN